MEYNENLDNNFENRNEIDDKNENTFNLKTYDMPWWRHCILVVAGFLGLDVFALIAGVLLSAIYKGLGYDMAAMKNAYDIFMAGGSTYNQTTLDIYFTYMAIYELIAYLLVTAAVLCCTIGEHFKNIFKPFKETTTYLNGFAYGAILILGSSAISVITNLLNPGVTENANQSAINLMTNNNWFIMFIVTTFCAPIVEELTYRLGLCGWIAKRNKWLGVIVSTLVFAFLHFDWNVLLHFDSQHLINELLNMPSYIYSGFILALCYTRRGKISDSIICHATNNGLMMFLSLISMTTIA